MTKSKNRLYMHSAKMYGSKISGKKSIKKALCVPSDNKKTDTNVLLQIGNLIPLPSNHSVQSCNNTAKTRVVALNRVLFQNKHKAIMKDLHKDIVKYARGYLQ